MAKITLNNATITEVFGQFNTWYKVEEPVDGQTWSKKYTVWADESKYGVGDIINVTGELTTKGRIYERMGETKATVDVSINKPIIELVARGVAPSAQDTITAEAAAAILAGAPAQLGEAPF